MMYFKLNGSDTDWLVYADYLEDQGIDATHIREGVEKLQVNDWIESFYLFMDLNNKMHYAFDIGGIGFNHGVGTNTVTGGLSVNHGVGTNTVSLAANGVGGADLFNYCVGGGGNSQSVGE